MDSEKDFGTTVQAESLYNKNSLTDTERMLFRKKKLKRFLSDLGHKTS